MATLDFSDKFNFTGAGYLDDKMKPVEHVSDLIRIPRGQRFLGLTVTVLDDGSGEPHDYWLKSSTSTWELKTMPAQISITGDDV